MAHLESSVGNENVSSISKAKSYEEMADFWDTHSLADYDDQLIEVDMTFDPSARRTKACAEGRSIGIEPGLLADLRRLARTRRISTETLVNLWLGQRVAELNTQALA